MEVITTVDGLRRYSDMQRAAGKSIGLVPTMGALHRGHHSLVNKARSDNDCVVVSIFVNPTQFNNSADLSTYPRTVEADLELLRNAGADVAFVPTVEEIYPSEDTRVFDLGEVAATMEGPMRPGHFNGVAQIVSKLFDYAHPTRAYFGEKDFQQIAVIRRMVQLEGGFDGLEIVDCPIVREDDGLALSSRNVRLTPEMRAVAPQIHRILAESTRGFRNFSPAELADRVAAEINAVPGLETEYYTIVDALTMQPLDSWDNAHNGAVGCVTVYAGDVRLIDNIRYL